MDAAKGVRRCVVGSASRAIFWIQICVRSQFVVDLAAQQVVNGLVEGFADNVPAGDFECAEYSTHREFGVVGVAAGVDRPRNSFDLEWISANHQTVGNILD